MRGEFFHILNRGIEDKKIFLKKENYLRFVNNMDDFNNKENATLPYFFRRKQFKLTKITSQTSLSKLGKKLMAEPASLQEKSGLDTLCILMRKKNEAEFYSKGGQK